MADKVPEFWMIGLPMPGHATALARVAEESGWDGLGFADSQNLAADPYVALTAAAHVTRNLLLRTSVTNPVTRDAAVTANAIASVQVESGGRAVLGIGRGDSSVGKIGQSPGDVATFERYLSLVRGYLAGETIDRNGTPSTNAWIKASEIPRVPIDVAGSGPRVIEVGARQGDQLTFAAGANPDRLRNLIQYARTAASDAGRDPNDLRLGAFINAVTHEDPQRARDLARGTIATFARFAVASATGQEAKQLSAVVSGYDMARHATADAVDTKVLTDDLIERFAVVGTPATCRGKLGPILELGLDHLVIVGPGEDVDLASKLECWSLFGHQVLRPMR